MNTNTLPNGCYLLRAEQPPDDDHDWPQFKDRVQKVFVYVTENELLEFLSSDDETIRNNVKLNEHHNKVDIARTVYSNKAKRSEKYENIEFLFNNEVLENLFKANSSIDEIYMQCVIAQHCRWHFEEGKETLFKNCMKEIEDFRNNDSIFHVNGSDFKTPTPEDIKKMKADLGIIE